MSTAVVGTISSGAGKVGRYFTVVSALPAAVLASYVYVLVQVAWSDQVRWSALADAQWPAVLVAGLAAMVLALTLNPLQFALIQLFEGYWGTSPLGVGLAAIRVSHHRRRRMALEKAMHARPPGAEELELAEVSPELIRAAIMRAESERALGAYPELPDVLPTRLGNVMRHYERKVGRPYALDPISAVPRLAVVAGEREIAYMQNQRVQLELAIRTSFMAFIATAATLLVMARHGLWLTLALIPYLVALLSYRGAVALAHEYGTSVAVLIDMGRFELYRRTGLRQPRSTEEERRTNETLMKIFDFEPTPTLAYDEMSAEPQADQPQATVEPPEE